MDKPLFSLDGKKWESAGDILKVDDIVRDRISVKRRAGAMKQPWVYKNEKTDPFLGKKQPVALKYNFDAEAIPSGLLCLGLERPELYKISVNGINVSTETQCGWWCDKSLKRIPLSPAAMKKGANEILLQTVFQNGHPGLEIAYLLGSFGVKISGAGLVLTEIDNALELGDCVPQGLPFYSGNLSYCFQAENPAKSGGRVFISAEERSAVAVKIRVNGQEAGIIAWDPRELEITNLLRNGKNEIIIEVLGNRRNSHGPFNLKAHKDDNLFFYVSPWSFRSEGEKFTPDYNLVPGGLLTAPELIVKK